MDQEMKLEMCGQIVEILENMRHQVIFLFYALFQKGCNQNS